MQRLYAKRMPNSASRLPLAPSPIAIESAPMSTEPEIFASTKRPQAEKRNWLPVAAAISVAVIVLLLVVLLGHRTSSPATSAAAGPAPADPYANKLELTDIQMSESSNFAGGKVTYLDGHITNRGDKTVTAVSVQVTFNNDIGELPQRMTVPMNLIRAHQPYIDTEHISVSPLVPGATKEFRLIFEGITPIWNQQMPQGQVVHVESK